MFSLRLVSSSLRGVSALASNQIGSSVTTVTANTSYQQKFSSIQCRPISTSIPLNRVMTAEKRKEKQQLLEMELNLPSKPKKPRTPWLLFMQSRLGDLKSQSEKMTAPQIVSILSEEWKRVDKTPYEEQYSRDRDEYLRQLESYYDSLNDDHKNYLEQKRVQNRRSNAMKQLRKTNPPKTPRNCAQMYSKERFKDPEVKAQLATMKPAQIFSKLFEEYRALPAEEKQKYIEMQEKDKSRFSAEFYDWYQEIQNNDDLSKSAREEAETMRNRFVNLGYFSA